MTEQIKKNKGGRPPKYKKEYVDELSGLMEQGMLDYEIFAKWDVSHETFIAWRKKYPELQEAYKIGLVKCEAWWTRQMRKKFEEGDDRGYKYCAYLVSTKFGWGREDKTPAVTNNTQINVSGNINLLEGKSINELLQLAQTQIAQLKLLDNNQEIIDIPNEPREPE